MRMRDIISRHSNHQPWHHSSIALWSQIPDVIHPTSHLECLVSSTFLIYLSPRLFLWTIWQREVFHETLLICPSLIFCLPDSIIIFDSAFLNEWACPEVDSIIVTIVVKYFPALSNDINSILLSRHSRNGKSELKSRSRRSDLSSTTSLSLEQTIRIIVESDISSNSLYRSCPKEIRKVFWQSSSHLPPHPQVLHPYRHNCRRRYVAFIASAYRGRLSSRRVQGVRPYDVSKLYIHTHATLSSGGCQPISRCLYALRIV